MRTIRPTRNLVVLQPIKNGAMTQGGLHLIEGSNPIQQLWRVLHVGPGRLTKKGIRVPIELNPGDRVVTAGVLNNHACYTDGVQVVEDSEIVAKVEG
jgi:chaperonin GroES